MIHEATLEIPTRLVTPLVTPWMMRFTFRVLKFWKSIKVWTKIHLSFRIYRWDMQINNSLIWGMGNPYFLHVLNMCHDLVNIYLLAFQGFILLTFFMHFELNNEKVIVNTCQHPIPPCWWIGLALVDRPIFISYYLIGFGNKLLYN